MMQMKQKVVSFRLLKSPSMHCSHFLVECGSNTNSKQARNIPVRPSLLSESESESEGVHESEHDGQFAITPIITKGYSLCVVENLPLSDDENVDLTAKQIESEVSSWMVFKLRVY